MALRSLLVVILFHGVVVTATVHHETLAEDDSCHTGADQRSACAGALVQMRGQRVDKGQGAHNATGNLQKTMHDSMDQMNRTKQIALMVDKQLLTLEIHKAMLMALQAKSTAITNRSTLSVDSCTSCVVAGATTLWTCSGLPASVLACIPGAVSAFKACQDCPTAMCTAMAPAHLLCFGDTRELALQTGLVSSDDIDEFCDSCGGWTDPVGSAVASAVDAIQNATDPITDAIGSAAGAIGYHVGSAAGAIGDTVGAAVGSAIDAISSWNPFR